MKNQNNLVAKHARKYNKAAVHVDKKKEAKKKGYSKNNKTPSDYKGKGASLVSFLL